MTSSSFEIFDSYLIAIILMMLITCYRVDQTDGRPQTFSQESKHCKIIEDLSSMTHETATVECVGQVVLQDFKPRIDAGMKVIQEVKK